MCEVVIFSEFVYILKVSSILGALMKYTKNTLLLYLGSFNIKIQTSSKSKYCFTNYFSKNENNFIKHIP